MTSIVIIPARYDSTRFPGKPLCLLEGKPLIQHVYENSRLSKLADDVLVATDSETIFDTVLSFKGKAVMTDKKHLSGTDRIAEVAAKLKYDIIVNVQADEPLIKPEMIDDVIKLLDDKRASIGTLVKKISDPSEILNQNIVKVVMDKEGFALYFSRSPIPFCAKHSEVSKPVYYKHIGIYSYRKNILLSLAQMEQTELERTEKLEQLRALENCMKIKVKETIFETLGVDTPEDLERIKKWLSLYS